jgi:hypothetical protein
LSGFFNRKRTTVFGTKKKVLFQGKDQPAQEKIMEIDHKILKRMQKKIARAMANLSDASVDATYIARFDETAAQRLTKKAKEIQQLSRELHNEFKACAPMEIWDDSEEKTSSKKTITWREKQ